MPVGCRGQELFHLTDGVENVGGEMFEQGPHGSPTPHLVVTDILVWSQYIVLRGVRGSKPMEMRNDAVKVALQFDRVEYVLLCQKTKRISFDGDGGDVPTLCLRDGRRSEYEDDNKCHWECRASPSSALACCKSRFISPLASSSAFWLSFISGD